MPTSTLYLCRHGETAYNADERIQGQRDIPLNATGRTQAARNGAVLRAALGPGAPGVRFLRSPLGRARETLDIILAALGCPDAPVHVDDRLMELNFGDWQGFTLDEIARRDPGSLAARDADKWNYVPPGAGAESYAMLLRRAAPIFAGLEGPTLVVAHGGITRIYLALVGSLPPAEAAFQSIPQDRVLLSHDGGPPTWL